MAEKGIKRPRDPVQLAKVKGDIATGQTPADSDESALSQKENFKLSLYPHSAGQSQRLVCVRGYCGGEENACGEMVAGTKVSSRA